MKASARNIFTVTKWLLPLVALPAVVQAQFTFTTNDDQITITGFSGTPTVLTIPGTTNDLTVFSGDNIGIVHYLPGSTGWNTLFDGWPTALWNPRAQTGDGSFGCLIS